MSTPALKGTFQKVNFLTIISLFAVILAGGIVRSSGSGMGCPDWPKCFGGYIPPTNLSQLPKDYKQQYVAKRVAKNQRFANLLDKLGYTDLAQRIRDDRSILIPEDFNLAKSWTEYANRLVGVISGFFVVAALLYSFAYRKTNVWIPTLSVVNFILIGFQGWLGSIVVSTNLTSGIVTVHMLLALAILALSIATYYMAKASGRKKLNTSFAVYLTALVALIISIVQIAIGSAVRERIDEVASHFQGGYREDWITAAGNIFLSHRDIAIGVLVINMILFALIRFTFNKHSVQQQLMSFTFLLIMLQVVTGIILSYWSLPPYAQAAHITIASLVFGTQFYLMLNLYKPVSLQGVYR
jgi:cytochrome c oxidase assembly protein subunit 15